MLNRRHLMCCGPGMAAGLFTGLAAPPAQAALTNPCRGRLPEALRQHPIVQSAFEGLDPSRLTDTHAHLIGTGDSGSGCRLHPSLYQWWRPLEVPRRRAILNAACIAEDEGSIDRAYVRRLTDLAEEFPVGARWWLYAFGQAHDDQGHPAPDQSTFHVPDAYCAQVAAALPSRFAWVASIHPSREDARSRSPKPPSGARCSNAATGIRACCTARTTRCPV
jgi:mannonate dehydratase